MSKTHEAKLTDDKGITRARVPAAIIKRLNGQPGDCLVFKTNESRAVHISLKKAAKKK